MAGARYLVVIGIDEYADEGIENLEYASVDAQAVFDVFTHPEHGNMPVDNARLLINGDATQKQIKSTIATWLANQVTAEDVAIVFFAGHGAPVANPGGRSSDGMEKYLVPHDGEQEDLRATGISMDEVQRWFGFIEARRLLFLIDSCYSGVAGGRTFSQPHFKIRAGLTGEFLDALSGEGRTVITACDINEVSLEAPSLKHGVFSYFLVQGLKGDADLDGDGRVGVDELYSYLSREVLAYTRDRGRRMQPVRKGESKGDFFLTGKELAPSEADYDDDSPSARLRRLRASPEASELPFVFRSLGDSDVHIRERALQVLHRFGWNTIAHAVEKICTGGKEHELESVLAGLASVEADERTVRILDRFVESSHGRFRQRAMDLSQRKKLALNFNDMAGLFAEVNSDYRLQKVLGTGLFGASYLAEDPSGKNKAVVRVLRSEMAQQDLIRSEFADLCQRSTRYVHQNMALTRAARSIPDRGVYYCIRDFIDGRLLQDALDSNTPISVRDSLRIATAIAQALSVVHKRGECHGGVKPNNIYLVEDDVILGDPALRLSLLPPTLDRLSYDYQYASPEVLSKELPSPAADVYALACVGYEMLSGQPPYVSDDPFQLITLHRTAPVPSLENTASALAQSLANLFNRCLQKETAQRPQDASALITELQALAKISSSTASPPPRLVPQFDGETAHTQISMRDVKDIEGTVVFRTATPTPDTGPVESTAFAVPMGPAGNEPQRLQAGDLIKGRFRVDSIIGYGGMSTVYRCIDLRRQEHNDRDPYVAVKVLRPEIAGSREFVVAMQREARKAQQLAHPNILPTYDFDRDGDLVFIIMELIEGPSLDAVIRDHPEGQPLEAVWPIIEGVCQALSHAHSHGIVHSDFKPGNCLIDRNGRVRVLDFGVARVLKESESDKTVFDSGRLGALTNSFASLEQFAGEAPDPRDDIYSLACTIYMLLVGKHPFDNKSAPDVLNHEMAVPPDPRLPRRTYLALKRALALKREDRSSTVDELVVEMRPRSSRRLSLTPLIIGLLTALLAIGFWWLLGR